MAKPMNYLLIFTVIVFSNYFVDETEAASMKLVHSINYRRMYQGEYCSIHKIHADCEIMLDGKCQSGSCSFEKSDAGFDAAQCDAVCRRLNYLEHEFTSATKQCQCLNLSDAALDFVCESDCARFEDIVHARVTNKICNCYRGITKVVLEGCELCFSKDSTCYPVCKRSFSGHCDNGCCKCNAHNYYTPNNREGCRQHCLRNKFTSWTYRAGVEPRASCICWNGVIDGAMAPSVCEAYCREMNVTRSLSCLQDGRQVCECFPEHASLYE